MIKHEFSKTYFNLKNDKKASFYASNRYLKNMNKNGLTNIFYTCVARDNPGIIN